MPRAAFVRAQRTAWEVRAGARRESRGRRRRVATGRGGALARSDHGSAILGPAPPSAACPPDGAQCAHSVHCERSAGECGLLGACGPSGANRNPDAVQIPARTSARAGPASEARGVSAFRAIANRPSQAAICLPNLVMRMVGRRVPRSSWNQQVVTEPAAAPPVAPGRSRQPVVYLASRRRAAGLAGPPRTSWARARRARSRCTSPAPTARRGRCRRA